MNTNIVQSNPEIRALALSQLRGNWTNPVVATLVYLVITQLIGVIPYVGSIISFVLGGAFAIGLCYYYLKIAKNSGEPRIEDLFEGFKQIGQGIIATLLTGLIVIAGSILLIVPGVIAALGLSQTFFIMAENPGISGVDAMKESWEMMKGYKTQLFMLGLSFIPWVLLSVLTLFIGLLWLLPYIYVSYAHFHLQLKGADLELSPSDHLIL